MHIQLLKNTYISIHFLHAEKDLILIDATTGKIISIHFLHAEKDSVCNSCPEMLAKFQSTFSMRRKTQIGSSFRRQGLIFQSTFSMRRKTNISVLQIFLVILFQSTFSMRRKTTKTLNDSLTWDISIHFLHAEKDNGFQRRF